MCSNENSSATTTSKTNTDLNQTIYPRSNSSSSSLSPVPHHQSLDYTETGGTPPIAATAVSSAVGPSSTSSPPSSVMPGLLPVGQNLIPPLDHYRIQLYNYAMVERLRCSQYPGTMPGTIHPSNYPPTPYGPRFALQMSLFHNRAFAPEEPKPQHSYIGLIAMAILSAPETKLVLSDIYQYILDNYPYFRTRGPGWRNSIRHNLSLNDCFVKAGRSANGKGHYWAIHPANLDDFKKGDFRRRKAQRKVRKHMGLAVDEEPNDSPSPPPLNSPLNPHHLQSLCHTPWALTNTSVLSNPISFYSSQTRKRQFDVASLLAPDDQFKHQSAAKRMLYSSPYHINPSPHHNYHQRGDLDEDIDVVASDYDGENPESSQDNSRLNDSPPQSIHLMTDSTISTSIHHRPLWYNHVTGLNAAAHTPMGPCVVDPRVFGRYYGQYMAAAQACRRLNLTNHNSSNNNNNNEISAELQSNDC